MFRQYPLIIKASFFLLFLFLFFYGIIIAEDFLAPLCLAVLLSYMLYPLVDFLERKKVNRILSIFIALILLLLIINGVLLIIIKQISHLVKDFPALKQQAITNVDLLFEYVETKIGIAPGKLDIMLKNNIDSLFETGSNFINKTFNATTTTIVKIALLPVFIFYLLYYRDHFRSFLLKVVPERKRTTVKAIMKKTSLMTVNYLSGVFVVVIILSVLNSIGLHIVGVKYAITFGIISALFNFIPYFGNWIGAFFPLTFALLTGDSPNLALGVLIYYIIVQFIEHNILTPNITGSYVNLNPLVTIIGILIGGMVWGLTGMFIVIPLMATVKIVLDYFESTKPYGELIGIHKATVPLINISRKKFRRKRRSPK